MTLKLEHSSSPAGAGDARGWAVLYAAASRAAALVLPPGCLALTRPDPALALLFLEEAEACLGLLLPLGLALLTEECDVTPLV